MAGKLPWKRPSSGVPFRPSNLREHLPFWEKEILKDHPNKVNILRWLTGVRIEDFLQSFTEGVFQGIPMHSYYPEANKFENYVPAQFETFMDDTVQEWESLGMLRKWKEVKKPKDPITPLVGSPLGMEPSKPRALWDGRYVNEFCRDIPFSMDKCCLGKCLFFQNRSQEWIPARNLT